MTCATLKHAHANACRTRSDALRNSDPPSYSPPPWGSVPHIAAAYIRTSALAAVYDENDGVPWSRRTQTCSWGESENAVSRQPRPSTASSPRTHTALDVLNRKTSVRCATQHDTRRMRSSVESHIAPLSFKPPLWRLLRSITRRLIRVERLPDVT